MEKLKFAKPRESEKPTVKASLPVALSVFWHHGSEIDITNIAHAEKGGESEGALRKMAGAVGENPTAGGIFGCGLFSMGVTTFALYSSMLANSAGEGALMMASGVGAAGFITMGAGLGLMLISGYYIVAGRKSAGKKEN